MQPNNHILFKQSHDYPSNSSHWSQISILSQTLAHAPIGNNQLLSLATYPWTSPCLYHIINQATQVAIPRFPVPSQTLVLGPISNCWLLSLGTYPWPWPMFVSLHHPSNSSHWSWISCHFSARAPISNSWLLSPGAYPWTLAPTCISLSYFPGYTSSLNLGSSPH